VTTLDTRQGPGTLPEPIAKLLGGARKTSNTLDNFIGTPGGSLLVNLLAQQGFSTMPQSQLGAVGKAALATQQQGQLRDTNELRRRFIESQIGLNAAKANDGKNACRCH